MKRILFLIVCFVMATAMNAQTVNGRNFGVDGFAAYPGTSGTNHYLAGGTTGGAGGEMVKADNFAQLQAYLQSSKPYVILVDHDITTGIKCYVESLSTGYLCSDQSGESGEESTYGERIMVASNKTLIGIADAQGNAPLFSRITFVLQCASNVIIRNCRFTMVGVPILKVGENKIVAWRDGQQVEVGDPDCIGIQADKNSASKDWGAHIWIDHCEFFNGNAANKDRYDGLVDCKNNVQWLTISYNLFHDHDKACLFGKGNSDIYDGCRTISFHHNYFKNIEGSRLPLQRGGQLHYCNNYMVGCEDGWDVRTGATGYVDACYFKDSKSPIRSDRGGSLNINKSSGYDCIYTGCNNLMEGYTNEDGHKISNSYPVTTSTWVPTATASTYSINQIDKTADVPAVCEQYSGAGKIVIWDAYTDAVPAASTTAYAEAVATQSTASCYDENGKKVSGVSSGGSDDNPSGNSELIFKMEISTSASDISMTKTTDAKSLASYCSTLTGGTAVLGLRADATSAQKVLSTDSSERHIRTTQNAVYVAVTLDKAIAAGDIISFTGNSDSANELCFMAENTYSTTEKTAGHTYTVTASSVLVGKTVLYISRAQASRTNIKSLTIVRPDNDDDDDATGITQVAGNRNAASSAKKAVVNGRLVIVKDGRQYNAAGQQVK